MIFVYLIYKAYEESLSIDTEIKFVDINSNNIHEWLIQIFKYERPIGASGNVIHF
jgi:hypothetical protein